MTRVGVIGARGSMGRAIGAAVREDPELELAAEIGRGDPRDPLAGVDVAVDVSVPDAVLANVEWCLSHGVHVVVGTSGVDGPRLERIRELSAAAPGVGVHVVPNFSVAAVLAGRLAADAARFFPDVEIVEYAGRHKLDAPSGTAEQTARDLAAVRGSSPAHDQGTARTTRGDTVHGIPVHSVRMAGLVSRQDVVLARDHELLTIHFETLDRAAFMPGVLLAVREIPGRPGLTVGLGRLLDPEPPTGQ